MHSGLTRLYWSSPYWVQHLAVSAYGLRVRHRRYGRGHDAILRQLRESESLPAEEIAEQQLTRLRDVVQHAVETVPLYMDRRGAYRPIEAMVDLAQLPLTSKDDLRRPRDQLISGDYRHTRLSEIHTGGTTGKPLTIFLDPLVLKRNYAFFARFRSWAGLGEHPRTATFAGRTLAAPDQSVPPYWRHNLPMRTLHLSSYHISPATLPDYVGALTRFRPELIDTYPSSIEPIARFIVEQDIEGPRPRAVITSSESLLPPVRSLIERAFNAPVFDHYGAAEMVALITQCEQGTYHVNPEYGVVELLREGVPVGPGEPGEIVATGFINPVMPLIRYATGDSAEWAAEPCTCGRAFPAITCIEGRMDDVLVTPEGRRIGRLDPIFKSVSSVYETQIVQDREDHITVRVVLVEDWTPLERESLLRELTNRVGPGMTIDIERADSLPRTASGKLRNVVNQVVSTASTDTAEWEKHA